MNQSIRLGKKLGESDSSLRREISRIEKDSFERGVDRYRCSKRCDLFVACALSAYDPMKRSRTNAVEIRTATRISRHVESFQRSVEFLFDTSQSLYSSYEYGATNQCIGDRDKPSNADLILAQIQHLERSVLLEYLRDVDDPSLVRGSISQPIR